MRRKITAVIVAVFVFSLIAASAASLGGISAGGVGADAEVVASCDTNGVDVDFAYAYNATTQQYDITGVDVSGIADLCVANLDELTLALEGSSVAVLIELGPSAITSVGGDNNTVSFDAADLAAAGGITTEAVDHIAIVIG